MKYIKLFEEYLPTVEGQDAPEPNSPAYFGQKGKDFYEFLMDDSDGPVDEFVIISRAFRYALNKLTKSDYEMCANVFDIALKDLRKEGGEIPSSEKGTY